MNTLIDSHCHLDSFSEQELHNIFITANNFGVKAFLAACADVKKFSKILAIAKKWPNVFCSIGNHPTEEIKDEITVDEIVDLANDPLVVAIGEIGLDYYYETTSKLQQQQRFITHIEAALAINKPIIVHTREAKKDTLKILKDMHAEKIGGIIHCFTEDWEFAEEVLAMNFYISFSGIVTFPKAISVQNIAKMVPIDKLLIETDSPYLAPIPYRGKTNQPGYVRYVAEFIAKLRDVPLSNVAKATTDNFLNLFNITLNK